MWNKGCTFDCIGDRASMYVTCEAPTARTSHPRQVKCSLLPLGRCVVASGRVILITLCTYVVVWKQVYWYDDYHINWTVYIVSQAVKSWYIYSCQPDAKPCRESSSLPCRSFQCSFFLCFTQYYSMCSHKCLYIYNVTATDYQIQLHFHRPSPHSLIGLIPLHLGHSNGRYILT